MYDYYIYHSCGLISEIDWKSEKESIESNYIIDGVGNVIITFNWNFINNNHISH